MPLSIDHGLTPGRIIIKKNNNFFQTRSPTQPHEANYKSKYSVKSPQTKISADVFERVNSNQLDGAGVRKYMRFGSYSKDAIYSPVFGHSSNQPIYSPRFLGHQLSPKNVIQENTANSASEEKIVTHALLSSESKSSASSLNKKILFKSDLVESFKKKPSLFYSSEKKKRHSFDSQQTPKNLQAAPLSKSRAVNKECSSNNFFFTLSNVTNKKSPSFCQVPKLSSMNQSKEEQARNSFSELSFRQKSVEKKKQFKFFEDPYNPPSSYYSKKKSNSFLDLPFKSPAIHLHSRERNRKNSIFWETQKPIEDDLDFKLFPDVCSESSQSKNESSTCKVMDSIENEPKKINFESIIQTSKTPKKLANLQLKANGKNPNNKVGLSLQQSKYLWIRNSMQRSKFRTTERKPQIVSDSILKSRLYKKLKFIESGRPKT